MINYCWFELKLRDKELKKRRMNYNTYYTYLHWNNFTDRTYNLIFPISF